MHAKQLRRGVLVGILLLAIFWLVSSIGGLWAKARVAVSQAQEARRQYRALEERRVALETNLATLATERGQDAVIRTAFGVAKPGEEVIVVVPSVVVAATTTQSWWQWILDWF